MGELIGKTLIGEARGDDFYEDRKQIAQRLRYLADKVDNMWLPDPDSDYYRNYRSQAKQILTAMKNQVEKIEKDMKSQLDRANF